MELTNDDFADTPKTSTEKDNDALIRLGKAGISANQAFENLSNGLKSTKYPFDTMIEGLANEDYHSFGGLSSTKFPLMDKSIRAFEHRHLYDMGKPAYDVGNLVHDCILLPELVEDGYIESPTVGLETLQANAIRDENPDKMVVGQGDIEKYQHIAKLVRLIIPFLAKESVKKEVSFFHKHEGNGLTYQVRPDVYSPEIGMLYDVKSTKANNHKEFEKIIGEYDYDLSIAFYYDTLVLCGAEIEEVDDNGFDFDYVGWICVPKSKPNIPFIFRCSYELMEKGRSKYTRLLNKYIDYKESEKRLGKDDINLIYSDIAEKVAHSWEYRKENYV